MDTIEAKEAWSAFVIKSWELPIRTVSEANCSQHWSKKGKRHSQQGLLIRSWWKQEKPKYSLPLNITLTRLAPRLLDADDNLRMAFKWIKDAIADRIFPGLAAGRADDSKLIIWHYEQLSAKSYGIRITFEFTEKMPVGKI